MSMTSPIIREVLPEEAYDYTTLHIACWQSAYRKIISEEYMQNMLEDIDNRAERCRRDLTTPGEWKFYCAMLDDIMIGRLILCKSRDDDKRDVGEVAAIYLLEEYWDKGYGRKMMDYALNKLEVMGFHEVVVWVLEANHRARRFYEKMGFYHDGTSKEIIIDKPLVEIRYVREILCSAEDRR